MDALKSGDNRCASERSWTTTERKTNPVNYKKR